MGEIKSTLDLVMEKTKGISFTEAERTELKRKEISQKAMALFHRYREGSISLQELLRELTKLDPKSKTQVEEMILSELIDSLSLGGESERALKGIEGLKGREFEKERQILEQVTVQFRQAREKAKQELGLQWLERLKQEGISGSAVVPNPEASPAWREREKALNQTYQGQIEEIKKSLRSA